MRRTCDTKYFCSPTVTGFEPLRGGAANAPPQLDNSCLHLRMIVTVTLDDMNLCYCRNRNLATWSSVLRFQVCRSRHDPGIWREYTIDIEESDQGGLSMFLRTSVAGCPISVLERSKRETWLELPIADCHGMRYRWQYATLSSFLGG